MKEQWELLSRKAVEAVMQVPFFIEEENAFFDEAFEIGCQIEAKLRGWA